jgi:DNA-binding PucR family transcriptional regulator
LGRAASGTADTTFKTAHVMGAITQARESTCYDVARDVQWAAQRDDASVVLVPYRERLLVFCAFSVAERSVRTWLQEAFAKPTAERCAAGVSRVVEGLAGLRVAVTQACDALDLGRRISGRKSPHYYEELGLYRLLAGLRARDELKRFYDETLGTLVSYDLAHGTELVRTLEAFFDENANASQTSRALYVHRNTLSYRLQRIVEITGLDLNDADARLAFQLALKVHHLDSTPMVLAD